MCYSDTGVSIVRRICKCQRRYAGRAGLSDERSHRLISCEESISADPHWHFTPKFTRDSNRIETRSIDPS
ncbi:hypothetical protein CEXT_256821 [Caerostris extrusa]|uniref:Uncharacterized protein n=1 Tax=Caerostris extrusa TaxID=172846 RepID=A0AAV4WXG2_CAEEX|nr:hypothetical protein CEXT_256821 [Caerostris extrusa]